MSIIGGISLKNGNISRLGFFDTETDFHSVGLFYLKGKKEYGIKFEKKIDDLLYFKCHYVFTTEISVDLYNKIISMRNIDSLNYRVLAKRLDLIEWII